MLDRLPEGEGEYLFACDVALRIGFLPWRGSPRTHAYGCYVDTPPPNSDEHLALELFDVPN